VRGRGLEQQLARPKVVFVGGIGDGVKWLGLPVRRGWAWLDALGAIEEAMTKVADAAELIHNEGE
jgi:hypothetical protein